MVTESTPPRRPVLTLDDLALPASRRPERLHVLTASELAIAFSQGLDLAEGKGIGHAQRVAYIATMIADAIGATPAQRLGVFFGGLLHDIGVTLAASDICRVTGIDEDAVFGPLPLRSPAELRNELPFADLSAVADAVHQHCVLGAETLSVLDLPDEAVAAVAGHHERWDGAGFPAGSSRVDIPIEARIVAAADFVETAIVAERNSLTARQRLGTILGQHTALDLDPEVVARLMEVSRNDDFWLGLHSEDLAGTLISLRGTADARKSRKRVLRFAEVFADISDAKGGHTAGHSRRTADGALKLARALGLDEGHAEMIRIAALVHDIGLLGVPARVMSKPDILSVAEMQLMRQHPSNSEIILQSLPGFEEIAFWVGRHHERPDGKGYPDMLSGDEIPLESRILSVADVHAALTAERAHRGALSPKDAKQILLGAAGTQLDPELARLYCTLV